MEVRLPTPDALPLLLLLLPLLLCPASGLRSASPGHSPPDADRKDPVRVPARETVCPAGPPAGSRETEFPLSRRADHPVRKPEEEVAGRREFRRAREDRRREEGRREDRTEPGRDGRREEEDRRTEERKWGRMEIREAAGEERGTEPAGGLTQLAVGAAGLLASYYLSPKSVHCPA